MTSTRAEELLRRMEVKIGRKSSLVRLVKQEVTGSHCVKGTGVFAMPSLSSFWAGIAM